MVRDPEALVRVHRREISRPNHPSVSIEHILGAVLIKHLFADVTQPGHSNDYISFLIFLAEGVRVVRIVKHEATACLHFTEKAAHPLKALVPIVPASALLDLVSVHLFERPGTYRIRGYIPHLPEGLITIKLRRVAFPSNIVWAKAVYTEAARRHAVQIRAASAAVFHFPFEVAFV